MNQDYNLWKHQVRQAIVGLSAFAPPAGPGFHVALQHLYAESHFVEFISFQGWRQAGLTEAAGGALRELQKQLDAYDEPDTDAAILADPRWWVILGLVLHAVEVLA